MSADALNHFFEEYEDLPRSTFFVHNATEKIPPAKHIFNPHPTIVDLDKMDDLNSLTELSGIRKMGIRTHSCVNSHMLSLEWSKRNFFYQSVVCELGNTEIKPYMLPWNIWEVPIFYMDNLVLWSNKNIKSRTLRNADYLAKALDSDKFYVFDFHPIHIALNTSSTDYYARVKSKIIDEKINPWILSSNAKGIRNFFEKVLEVVVNQKLPDLTIENHLKLL